MVQVYSPANGAPLRDVAVKATLDMIDMQGGAILRVPVCGKTDAAGACVLNLVSNDAGTEGSTYVVELTSPHGTDVVRISVPAEASARLEDLIVDDYVALAYLLADADSYLATDDGRPLVQ